MCGEMSDVKKRLMEKSKKEREEKDRLVWGNVVGKFWGVGSNCVRVCVLMVQGKK